MAEMTAEKAVEWLTSDKAFGQECYGRKQIAALIERQAAEIERLNKSLQFEQNYLSRVGTHGPDCYKWGPGHWDCAMQEIAKNDRMIELAVRQLSKSKKCAMWITSECFHKEKPLRAKCPDDGCWLAWLEKEAEGVE